MPTTTAGSKMQVEVGVALNFIKFSLYNNLPRLRVDAFAEEIEKGIAAKFRGHWYPDNPTKGAAYRCINVSGEKVDPVIIYSAINSGLDIEEVNSYLPADLTVRIDPGEVSFSIGEKGEQRFLYFERRQVDENPSIINQSVTNEETVASSLSSSLGSLSLSSASSSGSWGATSPVPWNNPSNNLWSPVSANKGWSPIPTAAIPPTLAPFQPLVPIRQQQNSRTMPAAMFAQTKFGSTKLKSHGKRSNKLPPTDNFRGPQPPQSLYQLPVTNQLVPQQHQQSDGLYQPPLGCNNLFPDSIMMGNRQTRLTSPMYNQYEPRMTENSSLSPGNDMNGSSRLSPAADHDWVDLSDVNVTYPFGSHLLVT